MGQIPFLSVESKEGQIMLEIYHVYLSFAETLTVMTTFRSAVVHLPNGGRQLVWESERIKKTSNETFQGLQFTAVWCLTRTRVFCLVIIRINSY